MRSHPRPDPPPSELTPDERRRELAGLLARGRLRDRAVLAGEPSSPIPSEASFSTLEDVPDKSLTVHAGWRTRSTPRHEEMSMKAMKWERAFAALERMTVTQLRQKYGEVFGEETNGRNKA